MSSTADRLEKFSKILDASMSLLGNSNALLLGMLELRLSERSIFDIGSIATQITVANQQLIAAKDSLQLMLLRERDDHPQTAIRRRRVA